MYIDGLKAIHLCFLKFASNNYIIVAFKKKYNQV